MYNQELIKQRVREAIDNSLSDDDILEIWNGYCDRNQYYEDRFDDMDMFNLRYEGLTPLEIAKIVFKADFNPDHKYYRDGIYGVKSYEDAGDCDIDIDTLVDYIVKDDEDFGFDEIREALDENPDNS